MADSRFDLRKKAATGGAGGTGRGRSKSRGKSVGAKGKKGEPPPEKRRYTAEEQSKLLATYIKAPKAFWPSLTDGTHVRYYVKGAGDGPAPEAFRIGGYIGRNPYVWNEKDNPDEQRGLMLRTSAYARRGVKTWPVAFDKIRDIYVRCDPASILARRELGAVVTSMQGNDQKMAGHIRALISAVDQLNRRMANLEARMGGGAAYAPAAPSGLTPEALAARGRGGDRPSSGRHRSKSRHSHRSHRSHTSGD